MKDECLKKKPSYARSDTAGVLLNAGKPVAVTSNRGAGTVLQRPGANPQLEQHYYQWKQSHPESGEHVGTVVFTVLEERVPLHVFICPTADEDLYRTPSQDGPGTHTGGAGQEAAALSMAEIASCSYEAR